MKAMILETAGQPLKLIERETPEPGPGQVLVSVDACAVCRTDLHVVDGDLTEPSLPIIRLAERVVTLGTCRKQR